MSQKHFCFYFNSFAQWLFMYMKTAISTGKLCESSQLAETREGGDNSTVKKKEEKTALQIKNSAFPALRK